MMTSYSVACPHEKCAWVGSLVPSLFQDGKDAEVASLQRAWFKCPRCQRDWEVQITDDTVNIMPIADDALEVTPMTQTRRPPPKTEQTGNLKIITFAPGRTRGMQNVIASELAGLEDDQGQCHLLLDFTHVNHITSEELGTLIGLHKKLKASGGRLTLFNLNLLVFEVFTITRLEKLMEICR